MEVTEKYKCRLASGMAKYSQLNLELHISTYLGISTLRGGWYMLVEALSRLAVLSVGWGLVFGASYAQPENSVGIQVAIIQARFVGLKQSLSSSSWEIFTLRVDGFHK